MYSLPAQNTGPPSLQFIAQDTNGGGFAPGNNGFVQDTRNIASGSPSYNASQMHASHPVSLGDGDAPVAMQKNDVVVMSDGSQYAAAESAHNSVTSSQCDVPEVNLGKCIAQVDGTCESLTSSMASLTVKDDEAVSVSEPEANDAKAEVTSSEGEQRVASEGVQYVYNNESKEPVMTSCAASTTAYSSPESSYPKPGVMTQPIVSMPMQGNAPLPMYTQYVVVSSSANDGTPMYGQAVYTQQPPALVQSVDYSNIQQQFDPSANNKNTVGKKRIFFFIACNIK